MHHVDSESLAALVPLQEEGWLGEILSEVKSGKEATVHLCEGGPRADLPHIAAKVYRPIETRRFKNDADYVGGRAHLARAGRVRRAVEQKSSFGRAVQYGTWVGREWEVMNVLHDAGAPVPRPIAAGERAILMPFLGHEGTPATPLYRFDADRRQAARLVDELLDTIELMLDLDLVHGDLSPYNVLVHDGHAVVIDFPQAIDPRLNRNGAALLARDVDHVCRWASKHGVNRPAGRITSRLWSRFVSGEIG